MLEYLSIATFGGLILWKWTLFEEDQELLKKLTEIVKTIIQENVLQNRISESSKNLNISSEHSVKLKKTNHLLFIGISRNMMNTGQAYLDKLVEEIAIRFEHLLCDKNKKDEDDNDDGKELKVPEGWEERFKLLLKEATTKKETKAPRKYEDTKKGKERNIGEKKKGKQGRKWNDTPLSTEEEENLNANTEANLNLKDIKKVKTNAINLDDEWEEISKKEISKNLEKNQKASWMNWLSGNKPLTKTDLEPVLLKFEQELMNKNVAAPVSQEICKQMLEKLEGTTPGMHFISTHVRNALKEILKTILTPKENIDILRGIEKSKKENRVYSIVFVGVNGVGKSTNLSKVCCWLQQNGHKVLIAACDTFRTGAVEQLAVHATRLNAEVFERGYRTDPTQTAMDALTYAKKTDHDVVLIDTAGRMQDNEPLMKALSKLVNTVNPDLVLFVGEALVGNDAVDQLQKYNQSLAETASRTGKPRLVDGIILSKFDIIDDKVGAAISMVYTTGAPIVFLGVGQKYEDLRRMNVEMVTKSLLGL